MKMSVYRASAAEKAGLPFSARSVGRYVLRRGEGESGQRKYFVELYWGVKGRGRFMIDGEWMELPPEHVCFFMPGDEHRLECASEEWEYHWMTMDGPLSESLVKELGLRRPPASSVKCPESLFAKLASEIRDHSIRGLRMASATAYSILVEACSTPGAPSSAEKMVAECVNLIEANFQEEKLNVNWLADELGVNRSSLSRLFHERTGVTVIDYIMSCRMQHALFLLKETDKTISEIGGECGYPHPDYFSKAFKKKMGCSPREFR